jgi:hypothetical protein
VLALSVRQPWAGLIASGAKTIEVRAWPTTHRGPLAIHAGKTVDRFAAARLRSAPHQLAPLGALIATAELVDVRDLYRRDLKAACVPRSWMDELDCARAFAWVLANVRALAAPLPVRGEPGLFEIGDLRLRYQ